MQGKRVEGAKLFEESLSHYQHTLGPKHLHTITTVNLLAGTYLMLGDDERAAALFRDLLPIERESYPNDAQLARTLAGLGLLHLREGKPEAATPSLKKPWPSLSKPRAKTASTPPLPMPMWAKPAAPLASPIAPFLCFARPAPFMSGCLAPPIREWLRS